MESLVDNDILYKAACCDLFSELLIDVLGAPERLGVLGAARFVGRQAIGAANLQGDRDVAIGRLEEFIQLTSTVEPTDDEQTLAADFELAAQKAGVALDAGESQLCAVLIARSLHRLCTGDKRAIQAIETLLPANSDLAALAGRIVCLEQLVISALDGTDGVLLRKAICAEPEVDKTLTICFSCSNPDTVVEGILAGLSSYVNDLRTKAPTILSN